MINDRLKVQHSQIVANLADSPPTLHLKYQQTVQYTLT